MPSTVFSAEGFVFCGQRELEMITRREARELAFQIIFEKEFTDESVEQIVASAEEARGAEFDEYAKKTAAGTFENIERIDALITKYCVARSLRRLSKVVLAVLRLAVYEIVFVEDIDASISINEAVELAKVYATYEESGFVNGVLGALVRSEDVK